MRNPRLTRSQAVQVIERLKGRSIYTLSEGERQEFVTAFGAFIQSRPSRVEYRETLAGVTLFPEMLFYFEPRG